VEVQVDVGSHLDWQETILAPGEWPVRGREGIRELTNTKRSGRQLRHPSSMLSVSSMLAGCGTSMQRVRCVATRGCSLGHHIVECLIPNSFGGKPTLIGEYSPAGSVQPQIRN
jgi:hypothetical protein